MSDMYSLSISRETLPDAFNEPHSLAIRIWHWVFVLVLTASLTTVLFASTVFRTRNTIGLVQDELQGKGMTVTNDQARAVAHAYSDKLWELHTYLGYVLVGLLLSRIFIEITQPREEKLGVKLRRVAGFQSADPAEKADARHYVQVKRGYQLFYVLIGTMAVTGLGLAFEDVPFFKTWHGTIKQIHSFVQYFIYGFIIIHLVGVIRADMGRRKGLVSGMIHGEKRGQSGRRSL